MENQKQILYTKWENKKVYIDFAKVGLDKLTRKLREKLPPNTKLKLGGRQIKNNEYIDTEFQTEDEFNTFVQNWTNDNMILALAVPITNENELIEPSYKPTA